jgi:predicted nucleic-acid-binding protein
VLPAVGVLAKSPAGARLCLGCASRKGAAPAFGLRAWPAQGIACSVLAACQKVFVAPTVLLESEWVLRAAYGFAPDKIAGFLRGLLGLPGVRTASADRVARALAGYEQGMDFVDALHLALSQPADVFYTFDAACRRDARGEDQRALTLR